MIPENQKKMEAYEQQIDHTLCNMFKSQADLRTQNMELLRQFDLVDEQYEEVENECTQLKLELRKNQKILGHTFEDLNQTKRELERY